MTAVGIGRREGVGGAARDSRKRQDGGEKGEGCVDGGVVGL